MQIYKNPDFISKNKFLHIQKWLQVVASCCKQTKQAYHLHSEVGKMIDSMYLENFAQHSSVKWDSLKHINLIIGANNTGKTVLLKSLYVTLKALEQCEKGNEQRSLNDILADKLYWTFQTEKLGDLVKRGQDALFFKITSGKEHISYRFGRDTKHKIVKIKTDFAMPVQKTSIFIPAREVLSLFQIILKSRQQDCMFGFDDTYLDLVKALQYPAQKGNNFQPFAENKKILEHLIHGEIDYDDNRQEWYYRQGNSRFSIGVTAEGIKKISILSRLFSNRYLNNHSVVFIDEIEAALHPAALLDYLDMIYKLSQEGVQFFISTHSYSVIKKLYLLSRTDPEGVSVLSLKEGEVPFVSNMKDGMPKNSIIDASLQLYEEEIDRTLRDNKRNTKMNSKTN